tara:strand:+ start:792 stop:1619 length:828 start_codon:yes stop_codon:yes gene_type:complete
MAINFPSTTNEPTDGSLTHTAAGVTWAWDGESWSAQGINLAYSLPTASANTKGGIKVGNNLSMSNDTLSATSSVNDLTDLSDVTVSGTPTTGFVLKYDGSTWAPAADDTGTTITAIDDIGDVSISNPQATEVLQYDGSSWVNTSSGGTSLQGRTTAQASTGNINDGAVSNLLLTATKTYALLKIQTSHAAWVTLYTNIPSRTADASRNETTDPLPGTGVIAEIITSDGAVQNITPGTIGWNDDTTPSNNLYAKVVNRSGSSANITVTVHYVQIEA